MKELSIFIDESGDFGEYDIHAPFYIIGMVFHDQSQDISEELKKLEKMLSNSGWPDHCVHAGPAIRAEYEFKSYSMDERQHIIKSLIWFAHSS
ncbi:MAG: DUF3800 domain-containing protein [Lachnospiraceae bacterium]|nr:DUF3800 domain-containing protein [Lachnospiraceae bacterium]